MKTKVLRYCLIAWTICFLMPLADAEEYSQANPFDPILDESGGGDATDAYVGGQSEGKATHPLQKYPVKSYTLTGVINSPSMGVAMIRSSDGEEFFVHEGDRLGNKEGVIRVIFGTGLEVEEQKEIILLNVRNRSVSFEKEDQ